MANTEYAGHRGGTESPPSMEWTGKQAGSSSSCMGQEDGVAMAKLLRSRIEQRHCCALAYGYVWDAYWGAPIGNISCSELICCWKSHESDKFRRRGLHPMRLNAELDIFWPPPQDVGIHGSTPPQEQHRLLMEGAIARRSVCLDRYTEQAATRVLLPRAATDLPLLPHDLLLFSVVLPHLPLPEVFRARAVCWSWYTTLSSPVHLQRLTDNPDFTRPRVIVQTSTPNDVSCLACFDGYRWSSSHIPLPPFCLRAASAGLLCFSTESSRGHWQDRILLVGNPFTGQWKKLPPVPGGGEGMSRRLILPAPTCAMRADPNSGLYKVAVVYGGKGYIYDSSTGEWEEHNLGHLLYHHLGYCTITPSLMLCRLSGNAQEVILYDIQNKSLRLVKTHGPSDMDPFQTHRAQPHSRLPALVCLNDTVFVVGRVRAECPTGGSKLPLVLHGPVGIWDLKINEDGCTGKWGRPQSITPQDLLEAAIRGSDGTDFHVTTDGYNTIYLALFGGAAMLAYNVASQMWSSLPGCPPAFLIRFHVHAYYEPLLWLGPI